MLFKPLNPEQTQTLLQNQQGCWLRNMCLSEALPSRAAPPAAGRWGFPRGGWWRWSIPPRNPWAPDCEGPQTPAAGQHKESEPDGTRHSAKPHWLKHITDRHFSAGPKIRLYRLHESPAHFLNFIMSVLSLQHIGCWLD